MASVLIFDDEAFILNETSRTLKSFKFTCDAAADPYGHGILDHECDAKYAPCKGLVAIISDYYLNNDKEKTGLHFLQAYKRSKCVNKQGVKLILSSVSMPALIVREASSNGIKVLVKPYVEDDLIKAIGVIP